MPFTPEELAAMAAADAEIEVEFRLTPEDLARSRAQDREAVLEQMNPERRKIAAQQKAYREANREKVAAQQKAWYEANRERYNAYMRDYQRRRRMAASGQEGSICKASP